MVHGCKSLWMLLIAGFLLRDAVGFAVWNKSASNWPGASVYNLLDQLPTRHEQVSAATQAGPGISTSKPGQLRISLNPVPSSEHLMSPGAGMQSVAINPFTRFQGVSPAAPRLQATAAQHASASQFKEVHGGPFTGQSSFVTTSRFQSSSEQLAGGIQTRPAGNVALSSQKGYSAQYPSSYLSQGIGQRPSRPASLAPLEARLFTLPRPSGQLGVTSQTSASDYSQQNRGPFSYYPYALQSSPSQASSTTSRWPQIVSSSYGSASALGTQMQRRFNQMDSRVAASGSSANTLSAVPAGSSQSQSATGYGPSQGLVATYGGMQNQHSQVLARFNNLASASQATVSDPRNSVGSSGDYQSAFQGGVSRDSGRVHGLFNQISSSGLIMNQQSSSSRPASGGSSAANVLSISRAVSQGQSSTSNESPQRLISGYGTVPIQGTRTQGGNNQVGSALGVGVGQQVIDRRVTSSGSAMSDTSLNANSGASQDQRFYGSSQGLLTRYASMQSPGTKNQQGSVQQASPPGFTAASAMLSSSSTSTAPSSASIGHQTSSGYHRTQHLANPYAYQPAVQRPPAQVTSMIKQ